MTTQNQRTAVAALDAARPLVARLDGARHPEELAADVIDAWAATETALRALLGGSSLAGQPLVSEVRSHGLLDYPHAHALLGFLAARDRAARADYQPTEEDAAAARAGFQAFEAALGQGIAAPTGMFRAVGAAPYAGASAAPVSPTAAPIAPGPYAGPSRGTPLGAAPLAGAPVTPAAAEPYVPAEPVGRRGPSSGLLVAALALVLLALAGGAWWWSTRADRDLQAGIAAYRAGQREVARNAFQRAAAEDQAAALPHVYLGRIARDENDLPRATSELQAAIRLDPKLAVAQREMGQLLLQSNRPDLAFNFLRRALELDGSDRVAQGWTACALARQGRPDLAQRFADRAGSGDWTACLTAAATAPRPGVYPPGTAPAGAYPAGAVPPGQYPPGQYPPGQAPPAGYPPRPM